MGLRSLLLLFFVLAQGVVHAQSAAPASAYADAAPASAAGVLPVAAPEPVAPGAAEAVGGAAAAGGAGAAEPYGEAAQPEADEFQYGGPQVLRIEPLLENNWLFIDADVHLPVSDDLRHFAERGVTLYFTADLEIKRPRRWWFDSDVVKTQRTWRVVYNALTRQWRIGSGDLSLPEATLDDALLLVRRIRGWDILPAAELDADELYTGRMRVRLDTSLLARPFRVDALNSSAWSLSTPWKDFSFSISSDALPR